MKLTAANAKKIKIGQHILVRSRYGVYNEGIVYANDELGLKCKRPDGSYFSYGTIAFDGKMQFFIIEN